MAAEVRAYADLNLAQQSFCLRSGYCTDICGRNTAQLETTNQSRMGISLRGPLKRRDLKLTISNKG